ncbi:MAG: hypothetical protein HOM58_07770 [Rhodospirillaceae bacterium]|jgi:hypothetical protein|nr:hypothetical protein [Rhodospirillaceae bacterium]MBT5456494.1 hypothetical protein [Rhodospirillaceae bacterium]
MRIPRYVIGALLFGLIYASIQWSEGRITDLRILSVHLLLFVVLGSALSWMLSKVLEWYKSRQ